MKMRQLLKCALAGAILFGITSGYALEIASDPSTIPVYVKDRKFFPEDPTSPPPQSNDVGAYLVLYGGTKDSQGEPDSVDSKKARFTGQFVGYASTSAYLQFWTTALSYVEGKTTNEVHGGTGTVLMWAFMQFPDHSYQYTVDLQNVSDGTNSKNITSTIKFYLVDDAVGVAGGKAYFIDFEANETAGSQ